MSLETVRKSDSSWDLRNLWRAVVPMTGSRACDGPSCRSTQGSETQYFLQGSVTVRPAIPLQSSESRFQYPIFSFSKCFETRPCDGPSCPWRSVVGSVASACFFFRNKICCSKRLNRSLQYRIIYTHNIEIIPKRDIYSKACKVTLKRCYAYAITNISQ